MSEGLACLQSYLLHLESMETNIVGPHWHALPADIRGAIIDAHVPGSGSRILSPWDLRDLASSSKNDYRAVRESRNCADVIAFRKVRVSGLLRDFDADLRESTFAQCFAPKHLPEDGIESGVDNRATYSRASISNAQRSCRIS